MALLYLRHCIDVRRGKYHEKSILPELLEATEAALDLDELKAFAMAAMATAATAFPDPGGTGIKGGGTGKCVNV